MSTLSIAEVIAQVDDLEPNQYSDGDKLTWLSELDGQIFRELWMACEDPALESFDGHTDSAEELLVPEPYGGELYRWYLKAKIAGANREAERYEQAAEQVNAAMRQYSGAYIRQHMPKSPVKRFLF